MNYQSLLRHLMRMNDIPYSDLVIRLYGTRDISKKKRKEMRYKGKKIQKTVYRGLGIRRYTETKKSFIKELKKNIKDSGKKVKDYTKKLIVPLKKFWKYREQIVVLPKVKTSRSKNKMFWRVKLGKKMKEFYKLSNRDYPQLFVVAKEKKTGKQIAFPLIKESKLDKNKYENVRVVPHREKFKADIVYLDTRRRKTFRTKVKELPQRIIPSDKTPKDYRDLRLVANTLAEYQNKGVEYYNSMVEENNPEFKEEVQKYLLSHPEIVGEYEAYLKSQIDYMPEVDTLKMATLGIKLLEPMFLNFLVYKGIVVVLRVNMNVYWYDATLWYDEKDGYIYRTYEREWHNDKTLLPTKEYFIKGIPFHNQATFYKEAYAKAKMEEQGYMSRSTMEGQKGYFIFTDNKEDFEEVLSFIKSFQERNYISGKPFIHVSVVYLYGFTS